MGTGSNSWPVTLRPGADARTMVRVTPRSSLSTRPVARFGLIRVVFAVDRRTYDLLGPRHAHYEPCGRRTFVGLLRADARKARHPDRVSQSVTEYRADQPALPHQDAHTAELAAEALLREHPNALVCGLASDGLSVRIPQSLALWGQAAIEGRALIDKIVTPDRKTVIDAWLLALREGRSNAQVRLLDNPSRWMTLYFTDLRENHGVMLAILIPTDGAIEEDGSTEEPPPAASRFCTLLVDSAGVILEYDEAFTEMFGYDADELIDVLAIDQVHPDDVARTIEGWLTLVSTRRLQRVRSRRMRKDGSCLWVDITFHNRLNQPDFNDVLLEIVDVSAEMTAWEALRENGSSAPRDA